MSIYEDDKITDGEITEAWGYANFGENVDKREIIQETLLQIAGGFSTGHTAMSICKDLDLVTGGSTSRPSNLTKKGKRVMYCAQAEAVRNLKTLRIATKKVRSVKNDLLQEMESLAEALEDVQDLPQSFYEAIRIGRAA